MKLINEQQIFETWSPVIESKTSIKDNNKVEWLSKYCHYHSLYESAKLNESALHAGFASLGAIPGQGAPVAPTRTAQGSGDKFPSLLPLAIQVAAKTVGFDIVPVIPMPGPTGVLTYLDYVYAGGKIDQVTGDTPHAPLVFRVDVADASPAAAVGDTIAFTQAGYGTVDAIFVGYSRISGDPIFRFISFSGGATELAGVFDGTSVTASAGFAATVAKAELVSALEDHVSGFSGAGATDTDNWGDNFSTSANGPMKREIGEETPYRDMGLKTFTNFVEAETFQVSARVTTEQIQDLNKQFGIDVVSMIENALVNEISQSINRDILRSAFDLGTLNKSKFAVTEGVNLDLDLTALSVTFENQMTFQRRIYSRLLLAANVVANRGRRGPANFVVVGPQIASALQDISQFVTAPFANTFNQNNGSLYPVGGIAGMTVYVDQYMKFGDTRILIGRKGADDEPGLKFMPYLMAESIQTITEATMSPKVAVKSRYALVEAGFHPETMYVTFNVTLPAEGIA